MKSLAVAMGLACILMAPAASAAPSDQQLALAKRYMAEATHMADSVASTLKQLRPMIMSQTEAQLNAGEKQIVGDAFDLAYTRYLNSYLDRITPILADTYSEEELTQMVAFYESPIGQSTIAKGPALQLKLVPVAMDLVSNHASRHASRGLRPRHLRQTRRQAGELTKDLLHRRGEVARRHRRRDGGGCGAITAGSNPPLSRLAAIAPPPLREEWSYNEKRRPFGKGRRLKSFW